MTSSNLNLTKSSNDRSLTLNSNLPNDVIKLHGCSSCEWKHDVMCPLQKDQYKFGKEPICPDRKKYLLQLTRTDDGLDYTKWQDDYNNAIGQRMLDHDYKHILHMEKIISKARQDNLPDGMIKKMVRELRKKRQEWESLWDKMRKYNNGRITRETAKQVDVNVTNITIDDMNAVLRKAKTIDIESGKHD